MKTNRNKLYGFTLIELLVVIAAITVLSSIILAFVSQARNKSKDAAALETLRGILSQAFICLNNDGELSGTSFPSGSGQGSSWYGMIFPSEDTVLCTVNPDGAPTNWPKLPSGWRYDIISPSYVNLTFSSITRNFNYGACSDRDTDNTCVACNQNGCSMTKHVEDVTYVLSI